MSISTKSNHIVVVEITKDMDNAYYRFAKNIARHLRKADKDEITALNCVPKDDVMASYETSLRKWIILDIEGTMRIPVALFGVTSHNDDDKVGVPWMVATDRLSRIKVYFMKNYVKYLDTMKSKYDILTNFVDVRNTDSIKWLKHIGFEFDEAQPLEEGGLPFHRFHMECK